MKYAKFVWNGINGVYYIVNPILNKGNNCWEGRYYYIDNDCKKIFNHTLHGKGNFPCDSVVEFMLLKQLPNALRGK